MKRLSSILGNRFQGAAVDSIILVFVQVITSILGLVVTKLLSVHFSLQEYGTYSQGMLIVTTTSSIIILGLTNAVNYFYNKTPDEEEKRSYVSTIFSVQYVLGLLSAILIIVIQNPIINYFNNEQLRGAIYIVAWLPLLQNLIPMLQVLFVSVGKAKLIAVRNLVISIARLVAVVVACYVTKNIIHIFYVLLVLDISQVVFFFVWFSRLKYTIGIRHANIKFLKPIFAFSIPMAVYILTNALSRDLDKYVISFMSDTETLAIYTNSAKILPFDIVTSSFITVLIPIITRLIGNHKYEGAKGAFKAYLRLGYIATWIMAFGAVVLSRELMEFLYDAKYLPGLSVFIVYIFVDMIKFANTSIILVAKGKTSILMKCSITALVVNLIFNILSYKIMGMLGPALVTLVVTFGLTFTLLFFGASEIDTSILNLFNWKEMGLIILELVIVGTLVSLLDRNISSVIPSDSLRLIVCYALYGLCMLGLNYKRIMSCLKDINKLK